MSDMAYVIPDVVLPLAHERFQVREDLDMMCFRTTRSQECRAVCTVWADRTLNMRVRFQHHSQALNCINLHIVQRNAAACLQAALEAVTATHQLESAIDVFSWSMRPLLRQGYLQPLNPDMGGKKVRAKCFSANNHHRGSVTRLWACFYSHNVEL